MVNFASDSNRLAQEMASHQSEESEHDQQGPATGGVSLSAQRTGEG